MVTALHTLNFLQLKNISERYTSTFFELTPYFNIGFFSVNDALEILDFCNSL